MNLGHSKSIIFKFFVVVDNNSKIGIQNNEYQNALIQFIFNFKSIY